MMVKTMDAYGLGVAATLNASTKMVFQSRNLMMTIDYVDQNSTVQTTQLVLYQYNAIRAPSMGLVDRAGPVTGTKQYFLGLTWETSARFLRRKKRPKTRATSSSAKFEKQSKHGETESQNFCPYHSFGNSSRCITAVKWDAYNVENTAGKARRYHPGR